MNHTDIDNIRNMMRTNAMMNARERAIAMRYAISQGYKSDLPKIEFEKIRVAANINVKFVLK